MDTVLVRVTIDVRVELGKLRPYPTIVNLPRSEQAKRLVENAATSELRWMKGVDDVVRSVVEIVEPTNELLEVPPSN